MTIIDHGEWKPYRPVPFPTTLPANIMFTRRVSDGVDWYEYVKTGFQPDTVKFIIYWRGYGFVVGMASRDIDRLYPENCKVLEFDSDSVDPFKDFSGKLYDPDTHTFSTPEHRPSPLGEGDPFMAIAKRLEKLDEMKERFERLEQLLTKRGLLDE